VLVTACGRLCTPRKRVNICTVKEVDEGIWLVSSLDYDLGSIELEQKNLQPLDKPFGPKVSPTSWVRPVTRLSGSYTYGAWRTRRDSNPRPLPSEGSALSS
jgi:hypothetical protein